MTTYSIYENSTKVLLVDNLTFPEAAEQSKVYMDFFETTDISVVAVHHCTHHTHCTEAQAYKYAYIDYFAELQELGNLT